MIALSWHSHPDVWLFVAVLGSAYLWGIRRFAPSDAPPARRKVVLFFLGLGSIWAALDWPIHELAESYLYSAHTVQHMLLTLVGPPLLIVGTPPWLLRRLIGSGRILALVRLLTRPLVALIVFNAVVAAIHWPVLVQAMLDSTLVHVMVHWALIGSALLMWSPVLSPLLELPKLSYPGRMFYLFLQSIVPTVPASFLTFANEPFYSFYATAPRVIQISALDDLRIAGLLMKIGGGFILWGVITVLFFKWYAMEEQDGVDALAWRDLDRDLNRMRLGK